MQFIKAALSTLIAFGSLCVTNGQNIVDIASGADDFSTLATLVVRAGLADTLSSSGPFLVYAPTNDAFATLPPGVMDYLLTNTDQLQEVLTYHVIEGGSVVSPIGSDIAADNGLIRVIDTVLVPSSVSEALNMRLANIVDTASGVGAFGTLVTLVSNAGLVDALSGPGPLTVFAPTDAAFGRLDSRVLDYLLDEDNVGDLQSVLTYHVLSGEVLSTGLLNGVVSTLQGDRVEIRVGSDPTVNDAGIIAVDIMASNGVIHGIDEVLIPPGLEIPLNEELPNIVDTAISAGDFGTLVTLVSSADLVDTLSGPGPLTVFAPTDAAFERLDSSVVDYLLDEDNVGDLQSVLTYHVVSGQVLSTDLQNGDVPTLQGQDVEITVGPSPTVNDINIVLTDIMTSNGVIHVIDEVLIPPGFAIPGNEGLLNIVETAISAGDFGTLVTLVRNAGLVDALTAPGPLTVFAPTDAAFARLDSRIVDYLLDEDNVRNLQSVLAYHVVRGQVLSTDLRNGNVRTLQGQDVEIRVGSDPTVNDINIVGTDILTTNGVIHVIDEVLVPPGFSIPGIDCVYMGQIYNIFEWAIRLTRVCQCLAPNWSNCERLDSNCGQSCSSDDDCGGNCGNCDAFSGICVPFID